MALGLTTESSNGDYTPIIKIDARAGRVFRVDRSQASGGEWVTENVDITQNFQAIWDMENIQVGWALFAAGIAPSFSLVALGQPLPPKPSDQHKQVFRLLVKLGKSAGGDVRELASQAKAVIGSVDALHTAYEAGLKDNPGKLPVVSMTGSTPIKSSGSGMTSVNYAPIFEIVAWQPRPADLGGATAASDDPAPASPAPAAAKKKADVANEF